MLPANYADDAEIPSSKSTSMDSTFAHHDVCVIWGQLGCNEAKIDNQSSKA